MLIYKHIIIFLLFCIISLSVCGRNKNLSDYSSLSNIEYPNYASFGNLSCHINETKDTDAAGWLPSTSGHESIYRTNRIQLITILLLAIFSIIILLIRTILRQQKHTGDRILVKHTQEWTGNNDNSTIPKTTNIPYNIKTASTEYADKPENENFHIMACVHKEMTIKHAYREWGLTVDILAERLEIHRNKLSKAINCVSGQNFNQYVNSFRIKEAIQIISGCNHKDLYIEELYEKVGFSNRTSFYRAFKQYTGLSPRDFQQKNISCKPEDNEKKLFYHPSFNGD